MSETKDGHSREDYEACIRYAEERGYWAMHTAIVEDGYDSTINWRELMTDLEGKGTGL